MTIALQGLTLHEGRRLVQFVQLEHQTQIATQVLLANPALEVTMRQQDRQPVRPARLEQWTWTIVPQRRVCSVHQVSILKVHEPYHV